MPLQNDRQVLSVEFYSTDCDVGREKNQGPSLRIYLHHHLPFGAPGVGCTFSAGGCSNIVLPPWISCICGPSSLLTPNLRKSCLLLCPHIRKIGTPCREALNNTCCAPGLSSVKSILPVLSSVP